MNGDTTTTSTRRRRLVATIGVVALLLAAAASTVLFSSAVDETGTVDPDMEATRVEIEVDAGAITLVPADELTVTVRKHAGRFAATPSTTSETTSGTLRVTGTCSGMGIGPCRTSVTIAMPPGIAIKARTSAGSITGEIVQGSLEATTSAGPIRLTVTGEASHLSATTEAGPIDLVVPDDVYTVDARSSLGPTRVEVDTNDDAPRVIRAHSEVGPITIRTPQDTR